MEENKNVLEVNYYKILGVKDSATQNEIKKAHNILVKEWHPDKYISNFMNGVNNNKIESSSLSESDLINYAKHKAEKNFKILQQAYETLSDPQRRAEYDQNLKELNNKSKVETNTHQNRNEFFNSQANDKITQLIKVKNFKGALSECSAALELAPNDALLNYNMGAIFHNLENYDEAIKYYNIALTMPSLTSDKKALAYLNLGHIEYNRKNYKGALDNYFKSHEIKPDDRSIKNIKNAVQQIWNELPLKERFDLGLILLGLGISIVALNILNNNNSYNYGLK